MIAAVIASALGFTESALDHKEHATRTAALAQENADSDRALADLHQKQAREMEDAARQAEARKADARARVAAAEERADLDIATAFHQSVAPLIATFRETPSRSTAVAIRAELDRARVRLREELGDATGDAFRLLILAIARSFDPLPSLSRCEGTEVHDPARRFAEAAPTSGAALYESLVEIERHIERIAASGDKEPTDTAAIHFAHGSSRRRHGRLDQHRKAANAAREKANADAYSRDIFITTDGRAIRKDTPAGQRAMREAQSLALHGRSLVS